MCIRDSAITRIQWDPIQAEKGGYKHFMLKEIWEQPRAIRDTTLGRVSLDSGKVFLGEMKIADEELALASSINIACLLYTSTTACFWLAAAGSIDSPAERSNRLKGSIQPSTSQPLSAAASPTISTKYFVPCHFR